MPFQPATGPTQSSHRSIYQSTHPTHAALLESIAAVTRQLPTVVYSYGVNAMSLGLGGLLTDDATQPFIGGDAVCAHGHAKPHRLQSWAGLMSHRKQRKVMLSSPVRISRRRSPYDKIFYFDLVNTISYLPQIVSLLHAKPRFRG